MEGQRKYILELTEAQYDIIAMCIEVVHRISVGQVEELNEILPENIGRELLNRIKEQAFPELSLNQSYKWCGGHPNESISYLQAATYAIYREMLHFNAVHDGHDNVYQSPTLRCDGIDIPKITLIDENQSPFSYGHENGLSEKPNNHWSEEVLPGIEDPGIPGKDFIPVEWVDACEKYGKWKIVKQEQPEPTCKTCGFYENNCPFVRGTFNPYPNKVCKDYTYSVMKEQEQPEVDLEKEIEEHVYTMPHCEFSHYTEDLEDEDWARAEFRHFYELGYELGLNARKEESK